ncbi:MAG: hypothetical protein ACK5NT_02565 [Pyrinomonadaceae bacterium]
MKNIVILIALFGILVLTSASYGQQSDVKTTPSFKALQEHKLSVELQLKSLLKDFTASYPDVQKARYELDITLREMAILTQSSPKTVSLLSCDYGNKLVTKISAETTLREMLTRLTFKHPSVIAQINLLSKLETELEKELKISN